MKWYVYILFCDQKIYYIGITDNLKRRLDEHIKGYSGYTKKFSDIEMVYKEAYDNRKVAEIREKQLKGWSVAKKKALISGDTKLLIDLSKSTGVGEV